MEYFEPIKAFYQELCNLVEFPKKAAIELQEAMRELFENAVVHAYGCEEEGEIEIGFELFENGIKIDVKDRGLPLDEKILRQVPIDLKEKNRGLNRVYMLVDGLKFFNLGLHGKQFSIIKYVPIELKIHQFQGCYSDIAEDFDRTAKEFLKDRLIVRPFKEGDEVWIPKLIYRNYGYTYFKDIFYYPDKILQKEKSGDVLSIVAEIENKIVGHFALVKVPRSNIAEIGIAVVDPAFKGMGIMKEMFKLLIQKAKELGLSALFGEAITFHPYSQRANARFGFCTTGLLLGDIHQMVRLKGHKYPFREKRGAVALEYKILRPFHKRIFLPSIYEDMVKKSYEMCNVTYEVKKKEKEESTLIDLAYDPSFNIATLTIDGAGEDFTKRWKLLFEKAIAKHPDMVYADINLEKVSHIDDVVNELRNYGFFYAGVVFLKRDDQDYLRMQFEASEGIEEENIVCYSQMCKMLHNFILKDKEEIYKNL